MQVSACEIESRKNVVQTARVNASRQTSTKRPLGPKSVSFNKLLSGSPSEIVTILEHQICADRIQINYGFTGFRFNSGYIDIWLKDSRKIRRQHAKLASEQYGSRSMRCLACLSSGGACMLASPIVQGSQQAIFRVGCKQPIDPLGWPRSCVMEGR